MAHGKNFLTYGNWMNKISLIWKFRCCCFCTENIHGSNDFVCTKNFFNILFYFLTLQYCIGFAIYQHESATGIHVFPILNPPPSSLPIPSLWVVPVHQPQASSIVHRTWKYLRCSLRCRSQNSIPHMYFFNCMRFKMSWTEVPRSHFHIDWNYTFLGI